MLLFFGLTIALLRLAEDADPFSTTILAARSLLQIAGPLKNEQSYMYLSSLLEEEMDLSDIRKWRHAAERVKYNKYGSYSSL